MMVTEVKPVQEARQTPLKRDSIPPWARTAWKEEAHTWIHAELDRQGLHVNGAIEQPHIRPWATVLRVPTTKGDVYFKATLPWLKHEVALTAALSDWRPDCTLPVLALDLHRGWLLLPDGGGVLRELIRASRDFRNWERVLPLYAGLQLEMAGRVPELLAMGAPDRRLATLPTQYEALLEDRETLRIDQENGLTSAQYLHLQQLAPQFGQICEELAAYNLPETLNHGDLHDGNIFLREGRPLFFDWGDSGISHPFYSLRSTLVSLYYSLQIDEGAPEHNYLRDVYLEAWTDYATSERLRVAFNLAQQLAAIHDALKWHIIVFRLEETAREEYAAPVPSLLQEFLELQNA